MQTFASGLSGKLKPGDVVSVIAPNYKKTGMTTIPSELQYVEVVAATSKEGNDTDIQDAEAKEKELPSTVTLLVNEQQSKILSELENDGDIHLSLVYRGSRETAEQFLTAQKQLNDGTVPGSEVTDNGNSQ